MAKWFRWGKVKGDDGQDLNQAPEQAAPSMYYCKEKKRWRTMKADGEGSSEDEAPVAPPPKMGQTPVRSEEDKPKVEAWNPGHIKRARRDPPPSGLSTDPFNPLMSSASSSRSQSGSRRPEIKAVQAAGNPFAPRQLATSQVGSAIKQDEPSESSPSAGAKASLPMKSPFGNRVAPPSPEDHVSAAVLFEDRFAVPGASLEDRFAAPADVDAEEADNTEPPAQPSVTFHPTEERHEFEKNSVEDPFELPDEMRSNPRTVLQSDSPTVIPSDAPLSGAIPETATTGHVSEAHKVQMDSTEDRAIWAAHDGDILPETHADHPTPVEPPTIDVVDVDADGGMAPEAHPILHTTAYPLEAPKDPSDFDEFDFDDDDCMVPESHANGHLMAVEAPVIDVVDVDGNAGMAPETRQILHTTGYPMEAPSKDPTDFDEFDFADDILPETHTDHPTPVEPPVIDVVDVDGNGMAPEANPILHTTAYPLEASKPTDFDDFDFDDDIAPTHTTGYMVKAPLDSPVHSVTNDTNAPETDMKAPLDSPVHSVTNDTNVMSPVRSVTNDTNVMAPETPVHSVTNDTNAPETDILHTTGYPDASGPETPGGLLGLSEGSSASREDMPEELPQADGTKIASESQRQISCIQDDNERLILATERDAHAITKQELALALRDRDDALAAKEQVTNTAARELKDKLAAMEKFHDADVAYARELEEKLVEAEKAHAKDMQELEDRLAELENASSQSISSDPIKEELISAKDRAIEEVNIAEQEIEALREKNAALTKQVAELSKQQSLSGTPYTQATASGISEFSMDTAVSLEKAAELVEALALSDGDEFAVKETCSEIERRTYFEVDNRDPVIKCGGVEAMLSVLEKHESHEEIVCCAMGALWNLTFSNEAVDYIAQTNKITCILQVMDVHSDSQKIQTACCATIMNLAVNRENRNSIVQFYGLLRLITAAEKHANSARVIEQVCQALYMLAYHPDVKRSVIDANALAAAEIAKKHPIQGVKKWGTWLQEILV